MSMITEGFDGILDRAGSRLYIGQVTQVYRPEGSSVQDAVSEDLLPHEILFSVAGLITDARARPLELASEVSVGDIVIIFSMDLLYNSLYYYAKVRKLDSDNDSLYMSYNDSEIKLIPVSEDNTEVKIAGGKSVMSVNPKDGTIRLDSDYGGVGIDAHSGFVDIRNDKTSLKEILEELIDTLTSGKVLTGIGPMPFDPATVAKLMQNKLKLDLLFSDVEETRLYPHIPDNSYTPALAAEASAAMGPQMLHDSGPDQGTPPETVKQLMDKLPPGEAPKVPPGSKVPIWCRVQKASAQGKVSNPSYVEYKRNEDPKLTKDIKLSHVTYKTLFPHKLKAQKNLTKDDLTKNLQYLAHNVIQPLKDKYPNLRINSAFRGKPSIKGKTSQHELGEACDLQFIGFTFAQYLEAAAWVQENIPFDQFIFEHGNKIWFHLSIKRPGGRANRGQLLTMKGGKYETGIKLYYVDK